MGKQTASVNQARSSMKAVKKGGNSSRLVRVRKTTSFYRPKTLMLQRNPKYPRKAAPNTLKNDKFNTIKYPLCTGKL